ncbi:MAG TPA: M20 family metallopeptidase [Solirubrobacteraceae bacterium]|nr:M20 family metallopeptidase [Solirubrobacteraceae bacterium]
MPRSTEALLGELLTALEAQLPAAVELRHELHAIPELAHQERRTSELVAASLPVPVEAIAGTGLLATVAANDSSGVAPVAIRAELDGLPVAERTGAAFSATGGTMHACGHDVHMAALVALLRAAASLDELPAPLLAMFQPSEEAYPSGAQQIVEQLRAEHPPRPSPLAMVAAHVHPELPWGTLALDPGVVNAASDSVEIAVLGEPTHGAYPHHGRDPILAIAQIVVALHALIGRRVDPLAPALVNVGILEGGSTENVVPARARARASLRTYRERDRAALRELAQEVVYGVATAHGCTATVELIAGEPALENDARIVASARGLLANASLGAADPWRSCGSDDFAFFGELAPLAMAFVGLRGAPSFMPRPLHHPELLPPDEAVGVVARAQALLYVGALAALRAGPLEAGLSSP